MAPAPSRSRARLGRRTGSPGDLRMTGQELQISRPPPARQESPADALLGLARLAAGAWLRSTAWGMAVSVRLARAALDPQAAAQLAQDLGDGLRGYARDVLGVA